MKTAIIIIFHNYEKKIDKDFFIEHSNKASTIEFCLVNNDSKDFTYSVLKEIKEHCNNVSVVDIKKFKSETSAIRAGTRYMIDQFNINHIGYVNANLLNIKNEELNDIIKAINKNQDFINKNYYSVFQKGKIKKTLFRSLFSLLDYLKNIKDKKHILFKDTL